MNRSHARGPQPIPSHTAPVRAALTATSAQVTRQRTHRKPAERGTAGAQGRPHGVFVDCEARGRSPVNGVLTAFGAVHYETGQTFHGRLFEGTPDPANPAVPIVGPRIADDATVAAELREWLISVCVQTSPVMVSDNIAYDFMWIAGLFARVVMDNPFGHSGRRISDYYAGLTGRFSNTQAWKRLRVTPYDHNPCRTQWAT